MPASSTAFIPLLLGAVADQEAGRLSDASAGFAAVLALEPEQPQALLFAGVLAMRSGEFDEAARLLERAVAVRPTVAETHFAHGNALWAGERRSEARTAWQNTIRLDAHHVGALLNLAQAQEQSGEAEMAVVNCRAATTARPNHPQPWSALASALRAMGDPEASLEAAATAIAHDPYFAPAYYQQGMTLKSMGRRSEAVEALRDAVRHQPNAAATHLNLANLLHDLGNLTAAEYHCRKAVTLDPGMAEAHTVLGFLLTQTGDLPGAIAACERAIAIVPTMSEAHCNLGIAQLTAGDLPGGFTRYEWRKRHPLYGKEFFSLPDPEWLGQPLEGKRIVIMAEQGLGDAIMFARYAGVLSARGATVMIACDRRLVPLLQTTPGVTRAFAKTRAMPRFDYWVDQMSLPLLCETTLETVPSPGPYLAADPVKATRWAERLALPRDRSTHRPCIGVVWAGNPLHTNDVNRSCPAQIFLEILARSGVTGVSLQVGPAAREAASLDLRDWSAGLTDYAETAGLIDNLDLVLTVDTSVAHLAASMGKPTWIMLPHCPEWRWLRDRADTPWYDCVRLFRQPTPGDWDTVRDAVIAAFSASAGPSAPAAR